MDAGTGMVNFILEARVAPNREYLSVRRLAQNVTPIELIDTVEPRFLRGWRKLVVLNGVPSSHPVILVRKCGER